MTLRLLWLHTDPACAMVGKILDFKGFDYEIVDADEDHPAPSSMSSYKTNADSKETMAESKTGKHAHQDEPINQPVGTNCITQQLPALSFQNGETVVGAREIIARLETEHPEPTLLPPTNAGLHQILARYFEGEFGAVILRAAMPELLAYYRTRGPKSLSRYIRWIEQRMGAGFCTRAEQEAAMNRALASELMASLEDELSRRAFILGRVGLADFALYGQLRSFACSGELRLPQEFTALREHFLRIDRITARLQAE
jgi:glutathione S-transferase